MKETTKAPATGKERDPGLQALLDAVSLPVLGAQLLGLHGRLRAEKTRQALIALRDEIRTDVEAVRSRDPAARSDLEVLLLYSGVHAILAYRVAHRLYVKEHYLPARVVSQLSRFFTGVEIHPGATIGRGLMIDHGSGVVIGETTEIGDNCTLYQGVTLGGTGKDVGKRHPTLGNNVMVGSGAKVLGPLTVGDNCKIASNAVLLDSIPDGSTAVGIPARIVRRHGQRVENPAAKLDQIHIPDPVAQQFCRVEQQLEKLQAAIARLEGTAPAEP
jgi:serine O-acetyltransferase